MCVCVAVLVRDASLMWLGDVHYSEVGGLSWSKRRGGRLSPPILYHLVLEMNDDVLTRLEASNRLPAIPATGEAVVHLPWKLT